MSYDIITDREKELSVLVDAELGRALGPVASGPNAEQVLEAFVGALGVDPSLLQHWEISFRWTQYLDALIGDVEHEHTPPADDAPDPTAPAGSPGTTPGLKSDGSSVDGPPPAAAGETVVPTEPAAGPSSGSGTTSDPVTRAETAAAEAMAAASASEPPAPAPPDTDPTATAAPSTGSFEPIVTAGSPDGAAADAVRPTVPEGRVTCPQCDGWRTIAENGQVVDCPLCEASGSVTPDVAEGYTAGQAVG